MMAPDRLHGRGGRRRLDVRSAAPGRDESASPTMSSPEGNRLDAIVSELELDIVLGRLRPQSRLVEDDLMIRFGAKRHMVRSALEALSTGGLAERRPNKGAVVRDYSLEEVRELYAFRADLHRLAVEKMELPLPADVTEQLRAEATAHEEAIATGDLASVIRRNDAFHELLFAQGANRFVVDSIRRLDSASRAIRSYRIGDPARLRQASAEHRQMVDAAEAADRDGLADLCVRHILPSLQLFLQDHPGVLPSRRTGTPDAAVSLAAVENAVGSAALDGVRHPRRRRALSLPEG